MFSQVDDAIDDIEDYWDEKWKAFCDTVATKGGPPGEFVSRKILAKLVVNSPVIMAFVATCSILYWVGGWSMDLQRILAVHDTWNSTRLWQYTSLVTHIFAHSSTSHLRGNMTHLLLVGPAVEHTFGSGNLLVIMFVVAVVSAVAHLIVGRAHSHQLGASGVVFACLLLSSLVGASHGKIPLAFVLISVLYLGDELAQFVWAKDGVSHHAHLTGGLVGAAAGFFLLKQQRQKTQTRNLALLWLGKTKTNRSKTSKKSE